MSGPFPTSRSAATSAKASKWLPKQIRACLPGAGEEEQAYRGFEGAVEEAAEERRSDQPTKEGDRDPHAFEASQHPANVWVLL